MRQTDVRAYNFGLNGGAILGELNKGSGQGQFFTACGEKGIAYNESRSPDNTISG